MREAFKMLELGKRELERLQAEALRIEEQRKNLQKSLEKRKKRHSCWLRVYILTVI